MTGETPKQDRRCKIYVCRETGQPLCCADCRLWASCLERCLNWPSRCRCSVRDKAGEEPRKP